MTHASENLYQESVSEWVGGRVLRGKGNSDLLFLALAKHALGEIRWWVTWIGIDNDHIDRMRFLTSWFSGFIVLKWKFIEKKPNAQNKDGQNPN